MKVRTNESLVGTAQIVLSLGLLTHGGSNALELLGVAGLVTAAATPPFVIEASRRAVRTVERVVVDLAQGRRGT